MLDKILVSGNVKWVIAFSTILVAMTTATIASAGHRWSGMDPAIMINGEKINATVYWDGHTCDIEGVVESVIVVPKGSDYNFIGDSSGGFDCDHDGTIETRLATNTTIVEGKSPHMFFGARVNAPGMKFRTAVTLHKNDELVNSCRGLSNHWMKCKGPKF